MCVCVCKVYVLYILYILYIYTQLLFKSVYRRRQKIHPLICTISYNFTMLFVFFMWIQITGWGHFLLGWWTPFCISCKTNLLSINPPYVFVYPGLSFCFHFWKIPFLDIRFFVSRFRFFFGFCFSFLLFEYAIPLSLASTVSDIKSIVNMDLVLLSSLIISDFWLDYLIHKYLISFIHSWIYICSFIFLFSRYHVSPRCILFSLS